MGELGVSTPCVPACVCVRVWLCRVLSLWPGLDAVSVSGAPEFAPLSIPSLASVSMTFPTAQALQQYVLEDNYGLDASVPQVCGRQCCLCSALLLSGFCLVVRFLLFLFFLHLDLFP